MDEVAIRCAVLSLEIPGDLETGSEIRKPTQSRTKWT